MLNFDAATRNSLRLGLHTGLTPNPGSELVQRGLREVGDPTRAARTEADGLRQMARLLYARHLAKPHERSAPDLVPRSRSQEASRSSIRTSRGDRALIRVRRIRPCSTTPRTGHQERTGSRASGSREASTAPNTPWTNRYWWDGMRRRQSKASILAGFPKPALRGHGPRRR